MKSKKIQQVWDAVHGLEQRISQGEIATAELENRIAAIQHTSDTVPGTEGLEAARRAYADHLRATIKYPLALNSTHLADARLFSNRNDLIEALSPARPKAVAEIGVAFGDFSEFLINTLKPQKFVAFDTFNLHEHSEIWGRPAEDIFGERTHGEMYRERFADTPVDLCIEEGLSIDTLKKYPPQFFDLVYVDAGHAYDEVKADAKLAGERLKPGGLLVFNDYTMFDIHAAVPYGVVQAVNELAVEDGWLIVGFALQPNMFCDIALKQRSRSPR